jgi:hypothetical protein
LRVRGQLKQQNANHASCWAGGQQPGVSALVVFTGTDFAGIRAATIYF